MFGFVQVLRVICKPRVGTLKEGSNTNIIPFGGKYGTPLNSTE
jgi:hypothetical protein